MHARVTTTKVKPDRVDEAIGLFQGLEGLLNQQRGTKGAMLLVDRSSDTGISVTLWETEADMLAVESSGVYKEALSRFVDVFSAPPEQAHYEVAVRI